MTSCAAGTAEIGALSTEESSSELTSSGKSSVHHPSLPSPASSAEPLDASGASEHDLARNDRIESCFHSAPISEEKSSHSDDDGVQALLEAVDVLSRLASLDTYDYTATMMPTSTSSQSDCQHSGSNALALQSQLDKLSLSILQDSRIPHLSHHIHRLQSRLVSLDEDAQQQVREWHSYQEQLEEKNDRIRLLEKAVSKLHRKTQKLEHKLQRTQNERTTMAKHVKQYMSQVKKEEELCVEEQSIANQLRAHERLLRLEHSLKRDFHSEPSDFDLAGNRSRCSSRDTVFSDLDMAGLDPMEQLPDDCDEHDSYDHSSVSSVSTLQSYITDDGVATVRYRTASDEVLVSPHDHNDYQLTFPPGTRIGLQFQRMVVEKRKKGMLNYQLQPESPIDGRNRAASTSTETTTDAPQKETNLIDTFLGKNHLQIGFAHGQGEVQSHSFLVCGHHGFDRNTNVRPPLGARLLKVNGESVFTWTLDQIWDATHIEDERLAMTFRNEPLSRKQKDFLSKAIKAADQQHEAENDIGFQGYTNTGISGTSDGEKDESSTAKRSMLKSFLHLNQAGRNERKEEAKAAGELSQAHEGGVSERAATPGSRSMLMPFLNKNQKTAGYTSKDSSQPKPSSLFQGATHTTDGKPGVVPDLSKCMLTTPTKEATSSDTPPIPGTPPSQKLKKSMDRMGKKFKGWMS